VKVPTGGNCLDRQEPASARQTLGEVSRLGAIPRPTVTVRMKENGIRWRTACAAVG